MMVLNLDIRTLRGNSCLATKKAVPFLLVFNSFPRFYPLFVGVLYLMHLGDQVSGSDNPGRGIATGQDDFHFRWPFLQKI